MSTQLPVEIMDNPTRDGRELPSKDAGTKPDLIFMIRCSDTGPFTAHMYGSATDSLPDREHWVELQTNPITLRSQAARLREVWNDFVSRRSTTDPGVMRPNYPVSANVDLRGVGDELRSAIQNLVREGVYLFEQMLLGPGPEVRRFYENFAAILSGRSIRIRFDSDLFLPWSMMALKVGFLEEPERNQPFAQFLGYRHQIEQISRPYPAIRKESFAHQTAIATSLNADSSLDRVEGASDVQVLLATRSRLTIRRFREELENDLRIPEMDENFMYFWCHGTYHPSGAEPARHVICLTDKANRIDADFFKRVRDEAREEGGDVFHPFILLNACHAGEAATRIELEHIGKALISCGADGVLGPQVKIPQKFAVKYAKLFIERYLAGGPAGAITHQIAREFADNYMNPLALTYTLHSGLGSKITSGTA